MWAPPVGWVSQLASVSGSSYIKCFHGNGERENYGLGTYQQVPEMLVRLHPRLDDALCVVDPAWIPLQAEEHLARRGGAVHAGCFRGLAARVPELRNIGTEKVEKFQAGSRAYNGALRVSRPARWSLWTWLRKQARGGGRAGLWRKKSTWFEPCEHGDPAPWAGERGSYLGYLGTRTRCRQRST